MSAAMTRSTKLARQPSLWVLFMLGAILALGFAPFFLWPLGLASVALLIVALRHASSPLQAATRALVWGMGWQLAGLYWLPRAFYVDAGNQIEAAVLGGIPALFGVAFFGTLAVVGVALAVHSLRRKALLHAGMFAVLWLVLEYLKSLGGMGFLWLPLGAMWSGWLTFAQLAHLWIGPFGGVLLLSAFSLLLAVCASLTSSRTWPHAAGIAVATLFAVFAYGSWRLATAPSIAKLQSGEPLVRIVQPNIKSPHKWDPVKRWAFLNDTIALTFADPYDTVAAFILPESAVPFYVDEEADVRGALSRNMKDGQSLLFGTVRRTPVVDPAPGAQDTAYFNTFAMVDNTGTLTAMYDKHILVPFGEFIPWRSILDRLPLPFGLNTVSQSRLDYTHGTGGALEHFKGGALNGQGYVALICYEGIFPGFVRSAVQSGPARMLLNITNDNWFTGTTALHQHLALAKLRAIETGLPLVRVANTGLTVVTDGYGREVIRLPANTPRTADVQLPRPVR